MNLIDCHSHSNFSFDAQNTVTQMCDKANNLGLYAYCITDHFESDLDNDLNNENRILGSCNAIDEYKKLITKTKILKGIEIGQPLVNLERINKLISKCNFDFVLASIHNASNGDDFFYMDYNALTNQEINKIIEGYFLDIYNTAVWNGFDILAHLTYPFRYIKQANRDDIVIDMSHNDDIIKETFKVLIQNFKGIEINSSGLFQVISQTLPDQKYITMFKQLGGEVLSIGSDSHCTGHIARGLERAKEMATIAGFKYLTYFEQRKPKMVKIY